jgi:hypothetical protein
MRETELKANRKVARRKSKTDDLVIMQFTIPRKTPYEKVTRIEPQSG